jgi:excinuclease UvrABC nuclease subunit
MIKKKSLRQRQRDYNIADLRIRKVREIVNEIPTIVSTSTFEEREYVSLEHYHYLLSQLTRIGLVVTE